MGLENRPLPLPALTPACAAEVPENYGQAERRRAPQRALPWRALDSLLPFDLYADPCGGV